MALSALTISTCMAPNMDFLCRDLADDLAARLDLPVYARIDPPWQERERLFDQGQIDLLWICGLPYVLKADRFPGSVVPLVAPVPSAARYGGLPVYCSDVVVHCDSPYHSLEDLRGAVWTYNEPGSHSGYGVVRYVLAQHGETFGFFGRMVESGAHQNSLRMIARGEADASAIDSTVLELELANHPELAGQLRVIDTFGPSPIPPWVAQGSMPQELRRRLCQVLTGMHEDPSGRAILDRARLSRFVAVADQDYNPIREMARF